MSVESAGVMAAGSIRSAGRNRRPRPRIPSVARLTLGLVLLNLLWRCVRYGLGFPIWGDEAFVVINLMRRGFAAMFDPLEYGQIVPLGFMWAQLVVTRAMGYSEWALRLLPFLAGVASIVLFGRFAPRVVGRWAGMLAVAILAASYYPVRHAAEVKPYASDLLLSLLLLHLAWRVAEWPGCARRWVGLTLVAAVGVWMSYPIAFTAGGVALFLLAVLVRRASRQTLVLWLGYGVCVAASFLAMFLVYARPHAAAMWEPGAEATVEEWGAGFPLADGIVGLPAWFLRVHTGNMLAYPVGGRDGGSTLTFLLVLAGVVTLFRQRRDALLLLLGPLLFTFGAAVLQRYPYGGSARFSLHMAPAFCLLAGLGLASVLKTLLAPRRVPDAFRIAAGVMGLIAVGGIVRDVAKPYKTVADAENRRVLQWLAEQTGPDDQWVSYNVPAADPAYGDNLYPRGGHGARHRYDLLQVAPVLLRWAPAPDDLVAGARGRTWLIVYRDNRAPLPQGRLDAYLDGLVASLGAPTKHAFPLGGDPQQHIDVYAFAPPPVSRGSAP